MPSLPLGFACQLWRQRLTSFIGRDAGVSAHRHIDDLVNAANSVQLSQNPAFGGVTFGRLGCYQKIIGTATGAFDSTTRTMP